MTTYEIESVIRNGNEYCLGGGGGGSKMVDVLLMGAGGGGGGGGCTNAINDGGGGGAGELKIVNGYVVNSDSISVTVGAGGTGGNTGRPGVPGGNGCPTKFGDLSAMGGGGGGGGHNSNYMSCGIGKDGANGGGAGGGYIGVGQCMGRPFNCGHYGAGPSCTNNNGNGGGGGGGIGGDAGYEGRPFNSSSGCCKYFYGGPGKMVCFGGTVRCIGGGGHGGSALYNTVPYNYVCGQQLLLTQLQGTCFGGGCGGAISPINGCNGTANTGGGGGGGGSSTAGGGTGGNGGSGLAIVRYPTDGSYGITSSTGGNTCRTCTIDGVEYCIHEFTSNGTFCITG